VSSRSVLTRLLRSALEKMQPTAHGAAEQFGEVDSARHCPPAASQSMSPLRKKRPVALGRR